MHFFTNVVMVDAAGRVLLQERDEHAPIDPDRWGLPGGEIEPGESARDCAVREIGEETGLRVDGAGLVDLGAHRFHRSQCGHEDEVSVFTVLVDASQDDVVCGEGRQMVFVDPATIPDLDLVEPAWIALQLALGTGIRRFASVALVDRRGWILLQERDEHPVIDPERWGFPGGHVEPGEDVESAAHRELEEETGVSIEPGGLVRWAQFLVDHRESLGTWDLLTLYAARCALTDADIECGEGRQMVFVDPERARVLPLTSAAADIVPLFLDSDLYHQLKET